MLHEPDQLPGSPLRDGLSARFHERDRVGIGHRPLGDQPFDVRRAFVCKERIG
jgi:hypothetical protein